MQYGEILALSLHYCVALYWKRGSGFELRVESLIKHHKKTALKSVMIMR